MDEKPEQIIGHIRTKRDELSRNLSELETRVRSTADWRAQFDKNPALMLGAALGGGLILGAVVGGSSRSSHSEPAMLKAPSPAKPASAAPSSSSSSVASLGLAGLGGLAASGHMTQVTEAVEHVKSALIKFGIDKVKEFLTDAVPGLGQHLEAISGGNDYRASTIGHTSPNSKPDVHGASRESVGTDNPVPAGTL